MRLLLFRSLWTNGFNLDAALADCAGGVYNGVEGPVPSEPAARKLFRSHLQEAGVPFIAEITTGGGYVPDPALTAKQHLEEFAAKAGEALECAPLFLSALAGLDGWPLAKNLDFLGNAIEVADRLGISVAFETHRSRAAFHPWIAHDLLVNLPRLRLTCDFSHWCCVCERLVLDMEPEILRLCAERADHIHARIGFAQGPQAPRPASTEFAVELAAHERWWDAIWSAPERSGRGFTTMTPEFGPDGYMQTVAGPGNSAAEALDGINRWMALRQRERFASHPLANAA